MVYQPKTGARIVNVGDAWPFPAVTEARHRGESTWHEINEERYWHFLEVLPPIYIPGGFMVSEASDHTPDGVPIYAAVVSIGKRHFMRELPRSTDAVDSATAELRQAVAGGKS